MFYIKEPSTLHKPWVLSNCRDDKFVSISQDVTKDLKSYHLLGIDFLYQNYKGKLKGAILNEDNGMNMIIQVCAFLNAVYKREDKNFSILVICPDSSITFWKYHLSIHGKLKVDMVSPSTCPTDGIALLLGFSNLKLVEPLLRYDYFSVIIDDYDTVATKMVLKKLTSSFNIGLTRRSFYMNPDQKLQWTMLNWSNPGCVGKLLDFYEIDNDNFVNFRDNYRHWWFRLTWHFCESFEKITEDGLNEYKQKVNKWYNENEENEDSYVPVQKTTSKKQKMYEIIGEPKNTSKEIKTKKFGIIYKNPIVKKFSSQATTNSNSIKKSSEKLEATKEKKTYVPKPSVTSHRAEKRVFEIHNNENESKSSKDDNVPEKTFGTDQLMPIEKDFEYLKKSPKKEAFIDCTKKIITSPNKQGKGKRKLLEEDLDKCFENEKSPEIVPLNEFYKHSYKIDAHDKNKKVKTDSIESTTKGKDSKKSNYVQLPSMDESPILTSIIRNFEKSPGPAKTQPFQFAPICELDQPNSSKAFEENDVLLSIMNKTSSERELISDKPFTVSASHDEDDDDFFKSLLSTSKHQKESINITNAAETEILCESTATLASQDNDDDDFLKTLVGTSKRNEDDDCNDDDDDTIIEESPTISDNEQEVNVPVSPIKTQAISKSIENDDIEKLLRETDRILQGN